MMSCFSWNIATCCADVCACVCVVSALDVALYGEYLECLIPGHVVSTANVG